MIAALYAALCGLLLLALSVNVTRYRRKHAVGIGDGGNKELARAIRVQANFVEYAPLTLLLLALLEITGAAAWLLHALGIALLLGRLAHAQGLQASAATSPGRAAGMLLTWGALLVASLALLVQAL